MSIISLVRPSVQSNVWPVLGPSCASIDEYLVSFGQKGIAVRQRVRKLLHLLTSLGGSQSVQFVKVMHATQLMRELEIEKGDDCHPDEFRRKLMQRGFSLPSPVFALDMALQIDDSPSHEHEAYKVILLTRPFAISIEENAGHVFFLERERCTWFLDAMSVKKIDITLRTRVALTYILPSPN